MNHKPLVCLISCVVAASLAFASPALGRGGGHGAGGFGAGGFGGRGGVGLGAMPAMGGGVHFAAMGAQPRFTSMPFAHGGFSPRFAHAGFPHHFFHHRFHRFAFVGVPFAYADYGYYDGCWRRIWTAYGPRWTNVCAAYGYY